MPIRRPLACRLDLPESYRPKATYALATLLRPLGIEPVWVGQGDPELYYGPTDQAPAGAVALRFDMGTAAFFDTLEAYDHQRLGWAEWDGDTWPVLFPGAAGEGDIVAAAFYWLSGWQETTTRRRDVHGRFAYDASLQARLGCVDQPLVDIYRELLAHRLEARGIATSRTVWSGQSWAVAMTHDIDLLRKRRLGTLARALRRTDGRRAQAARQAVTAPNPRRASIERFVRVERARDAGATYFFKTAARGRWDVPYAHDGAWLRSTVRALEASGFEIGLHPSYYAHDHLGQLWEEKRRLDGLTQRPASSVRQHFLRFDAATPRIQQAAGFSLDSSLGYSAHEGFRRGTCFPFQIYDVAEDAPLNVWELPLAAMDTTLFTHRGLGPRQVERVVGDLYAACKRVGGCCVVLWHNTVYDEVDYPGQGEVFERVLDIALGDGAAVLSLRDALAAFVGDA